MHRMNEFPFPLTNGWGRSYKKNHHIHLKRDVDVATAKERWQGCNPQKDLDPGHFQTECTKLLRVGFGAAFCFGANVQSFYGFFFWGGAGGHHNQCF